ncbi:unannotated protein [freshwater metagenome]|uniref:Unannotated protein n=1 Tax=freshwater metagenome TaxID=449393 RepID=A0A6J7KRN9_9ZZZZ|nr:DUF2236 domain-containing protein [Actinomycetota bacterium]
MLKNNRVQEFFSIRFRRLLSGDPQGVPPWLETIGAGETGGLFEPGDAPWVVHRDFGTLVGGIRALLMQALHPGSLAGVAQHSRYEQDALGRLSGTIRWLTVTTFGSHEAVAGEANRVNRLHERVKGEYVKKDKPVSYRAADPDLLLWVHLAFTESFLVAHNLLCDEKVDPDEYVEQWGRSVTPLGLTKTPHTFLELEAQIAEFDCLRADELTKRVVSFIKRPPLPILTRPAYFLLFAAAVASLKDNQRELLGLKKPNRLVVPATRILLKTIRLMIGPESPIEQAALDRLARIKSQALG